MNAAAGLEVVACTGCWRIGLEEAKRLRPDVVLLETKRTDGQGLNALRCLIRQFPTSNIVVLTSYADAAERAMALEIGASRYVLKNIDTPQLAREIRAAARV